VRALPPDAARLMNDSSAGSPLGSSWILVARSSRSTARQS